MEKIPVRATIFSAALIIPYIIGVSLVLAFGSAGRNEERLSASVYTILASMLMLRCPLTALITYATKKTAA